jgi:hypothetical protein
MPIRTGSVREVNPHPKFPRRHDVWLREQERGERGPNTPLFTLEPQGREWMATFCAAAKTKERRIIVWTRDTRYGEEIIKVDFAPEQQEQGAA